MVITNQRVRMTMKSKGEAAATPEKIVNEIVIGGRVSGSPEQRDLPSGDNRRSAATGGPQIPYPRGGWPQGRNRGHH
jgi:hypothetical protein